MCHPMFMVFMISYHIQENTIRKWNILAYRWSVDDLVSTGLNSKKVRPTSTWICFRRDISASCSSTWSIKRKQNARPVVHWTWGQHTGCLLLVLKCVKLYASPRIIDFVYVCIVFGFRTFAMVWKPPEKRPVSTSGTPWGLFWCFCSSTGAEDHFVLRVIAESWLSSVFLHVKIDPSENNLYKLLIIARTDLFVARAGYSQAQVSHA